MRKGKSTTTSGMQWNTMLGLSMRLKEDGLIREHLLITLGCYFGLRIRDLRSIKWSDVQNKTEIFITEHKTKKVRKITINPKVSETIEFCSQQLKAKNKFKEDGFIFANRWGDPVSISYINKLLKVIFRKYDVQVQNPSSHTLRKTFGKRIFDADNKSERSIIMLAEIFNHSSLGITRKYIGITEENIADIYMSL